MNLSDSILVLGMTFLVLTGLDYISAPGIAGEDMVVALEMFQGDPSDGLGIRVKEGDPEDGLDHPIVKSIGAPLVGLVEPWVGLAIDREKGLITLLGDPDDGLEKSWIYRDQGNSYLFLVIRGKINDLQSSNS